jgi:hypothetical protein
MNIDQAFQTLRGILRKLNIPLDDHEVLQQALSILYNGAKENQESEQKRENGTGTNIIPIR